MACQRYEAWLREDALGALDRARATDLHSHLETCVECRSELERERLLLAAIDRRLSTALEASPSPELVARVRARVAAEPARSWAALPRWVLAAAGALAVCALLASWLARHPSPRHGPTTAKLAAPKNPHAAPFLRTEPAREQAAARPLRPVRTIRRVEPEVLIDPAAELSLARFYNALRAGRVDASSLITVPAGFERREDGSIVPKPLEIEPLKIAALRDEPQPDAEKTDNTQ